MLKYVLLTVLLVHGAICDFGGMNAANEMQVYEVRNLTCSDSGCKTSFTVNFYGTVSTYTFEYATDPSYRIECTELAGDTDRRLFYAQEDKSHPFRWCSELLARAETVFGFDWRTELCFNNDMSRVTAPPECPKPVMLAVLEGHLGDNLEKYRHTLYCLT